MFYSTGVAWPYAGYATPLVVIVVCLLMLLFKATYDALRNLLVIDAALVLCAAVNTAYLGTIGLFTTMARQGDRNYPPLCFVQVALAPIN